MPSPRWGDVEIGNLRTAHRPMHVVHFIPSEKADRNAVALNNQHMLSTGGAEYVTAQLIGGAAGMVGIALVEIIPKQLRKTLSIVRIRYSHVHKMSGCWLTRIRPQASGLEAVGNHAG
ncbi:MAG: hypothetical protein M3Z30_00375 [Gemmatimonadota bacterium]|nr:hypothetical protein [Gemmatimonadota bacterium]